MNEQECTCGIEGPGCEKCHECDPTRLHWHCLDFGWRLISLQALRICEMYDGPQETWDLAVQLLQDGSDPDRAIGIALEIHREVAA